MKKQVVLTAVASLLTFASVAVLPAFAQDTGGTPYNPKPRDEYSRSRGDHNRHHGQCDWRGQGGYGSGYGSGSSGIYSKDRNQDRHHGQCDWRGQGGYGSGYGSGSSGKDRPSKDTYGKEQPKGYGSYGSGYDSRYGYRS
jgi:hypothetical protein